MAVSDAEPPQCVRARLWDAPTRIFHWMLVGLIGFSWWSAETDHMQWHMWSGYSILALIVFRLYWGFAGGASARFASFVRGPKATLAYARTLGRRAPSETPGHNPMGGLSVLAMLAAIGVQVVTGLFAVDVDGIESGPLSNRVDFDTGRVFAEIHEWSFTAIQVLVVLHLAAILFYLVYKRSDLIGAMITGKRRFAKDPELAFAPWWRVLIGVALALALMWWTSKGLRF